MGVAIEVCLRDTIPRALKHNRDTVDIEGLVIQEVPRYLASALFLVI